MNRGSGSGFVDPTTGAFTNPLLAADGAVGAPSYSFTSQAGTGIYYTATGNLNFASSGAFIAQFNSTGLVLGSSRVIQMNTGGTPAMIGDDGTNNTVAIKNGNSAQNLRIYAGNGGFISNIQAVTESLTIAAAATTVGATSIPAGAILLGVSVRVTTVIPTAATFTYATTVGATALSTAAVSAAANSTDPGTAAGASYRAAATTVTITPNATPGAATGVVRLQYYYLQVTPPTS